MASCSRLVSARQLAYCEVLSMESPYLFSVIGYPGNEDRILQMRNRNRPTRRQRQYLDWRYLGEQKEAAPCTFWMHDKSGEPLALASLIFRPYFVDGKKQLFGVLGDISVNQERRGEGLSKELFQFMNQYIERENLPCAFVLPNKAAEKALVSSGWKIVGHMVPLVCVVEPVAKFKKLFRIGFIAQLASFVLRTFARVLIRLQTRPDITMRVVREFDSEFDDLWKTYPKNNLVIHDRSAAALTWRYCKQPDKDFQIAKFYQRGEFIGYAVSDVSEKDGMCLVSDFLVANDKLIQPCMAAFLHGALKNTKVVTIRIVLIEGGKHAKQLWKFSFLKREPTTALLVFHPTDERLQTPSNWFLTAGDKDA